MVLRRNQRLKLDGDKLDRVIADRNLDTSEILRLSKEVFGREWESLNYLGKLRRGTPTTIETALGIARIFEVNIWEILPDEFLEQFYPLTGDAFAEAQEVYKSHYRKIPAYQFSDIRDDITKLDIKPQEQFELRVGGFDDPDAYALIIKDEYGIPAHFHNRIAIVSPLATKEIRNGEDYCFVVTSDNKAYIRNVTVKGEIVFLAPEASGQPIVIDKDDVKVLHTVLIWVRQ